MGLPVLPAAFDGVRGAVFGVLLTGLLIAGVIVLVVNLGTQRRPAPAGTPSPGNAAPASAPSSPPAAASAAPLPASPPAETWQPVDGPDVPRKAPSRRAPARSSPQGKRRRA